MKGGPKTRLKGAKLNFKNINVVQLYRKIQTHIQIAVGFSIQFDRSSPIIQPLNTQCYNFIMHNLIQISVFG